MNNDQIKTFDEYLEGGELLTHMELELTCGKKFVDVGTSLGLNRYALRRKLQSLGWGGVYHDLYPKDLDEMIPQNVPLTRARCNWGIRFAQATLCQEGYKIPRRMVRDSMHQLQPKHMTRHEVRRLNRGQYIVTTPMVLWHMDCKNSLK